MRRADPCVVLLHERDELERMLDTLVHIKGCIRSFEDGEINLREAVCQIAAAISTGREISLSGKALD
jgi:hypothetical protein